MIDPGNQQIGFSVEDFVHCKLYAIYGCSGALPAFYAFKNLYTIEP
jgi:hypothetical protein